MSISSKPEIIGLAGTFASGKDTLAKRLVADFGYTHVSTSDLVRKVAQQERGSIERPVLFEVATKHRQADGAGYFAELALQSEKPLIVSGLRSLGEMRTVRQAGGVIVFVDAPVEMRYERMKARERDAEAVLTLEQFRANEEKEMYSGPNDADFNLGQIKAEADVVIENSVTLESFLAECYARLGLN